MRAELIEPGDARWLHLVETAPQATIFHQPAWIGLLEKSYGHDMAVLGVLDGDRAVAGIPLAKVSSRLTGRRLVALPFSDVCPPLVLPEAAGAETVLGRALAAHAEAAGLPLEVRAAMPEIPAASVLDRYHLHEVDLREPPRFSSMTARNIRKAERAGVSVSRRTDREALDLFYVLHAETRRRQGVPTQPRRFIRALEGLFAKDLGHVALARVNGTAAAAAVFLTTGSTVTYKYGASDRAALAARPNHLLFAETIDWAREQGFSHLDLGRTDFGHEGLRAFKASWGGDERPLGYTYLGHDPGAPGEGRAQRALAPVIRRSPTVVGRAIGSVLYRHAS